MKDIDHFAFPLPFNSELNLPYRANQTLKDMVDYLFSHPTLPKTHRDLYNNVSKGGSKCLTNDMARVAIALCREFLANPQHYGGALENIQMQILVRMWKMTFLHVSVQGVEVDMYYKTKMKMLSIENGFWDELIRVVQVEDYIQDSVQMRKKPKKRRTRSGGRAYIDYLCSLD